MPLGLLGSARVAFAAGDLNVRVYNDADRNGVGAAGEAGISGVSVAVYSADDLLVALNSTDVSGAVSFPNLSDGEYRVEVVPPAGHVVSVPGVANTNPGLVSRVEVKGSVVALNVGLRQLTGATDPVAPAGTRSITTRVWNDLDSDGTQDADEPGFENLILNLIDTNGAVVGTAVAGPDGRYHFATAPSGVALRVRVENPPAEYGLTRQDAGPSDGRDSDAFVTTFPPALADVPVTARGVNLDSVDIGFTRAAVSGFIWRDSNANGSYDLGEARLNGIAVELINASNAVVATATTRSQIGEGGLAGFYEFLNLPLGTYRVRVPTSQFQAGGPLFGAATPPNVQDRGLINGATASGVPAPTDTVDTAPFTLSFSDIAAGSNRDAAAHFGFYKGIVGDFVWNDLNRDGSQDNEATLGQNGVLIFVDDGRGGGTPNDGELNGGEISTTTTSDPDSGRPGFYRFDDLPLGAAYRIVLDSSNFAPGGPLEGVGSSTATAATNAAGQPYYYIDTPALATDAPTNLGIDFGLTRSDVGNTVFVDANGNGIFDLGEAPIPGVTVRLVRAGSNTVVFTTTTDASGLYTIGNQPALSYYATFDLSTAPAFAGFVASPQQAGVTVDPQELSFVDRSDLILPAVNATTWRTPAFTPAISAVNKGIDAGFFQTLTVAGRAFFDANGNNQDEATPEAGMRGVAVELRRNTPELTVVASTTTDTTGAYSFSDVAPGSYVVEFKNPAADGFAFVTADAPAAGDPLASDVGATGRTPVLDLVSGTKVLDVDAGFTGRGQVAGRVFFDVDGSNTQTAGDTNLSGAAATLTVTANTPNLVLTYTPANQLAAPTANADPNYRFVGLPGGAGVSYDLDFTPPVAPPAYQPSVADQGDDAIDSDGPSVTVTDPAAGAALDFDQGYLTAGTVSGKVFFDGTSAAPDNQLAGDPALTGVTVRLLNSALTEVASTVVDATGAYTFTSVAPGTYTVEFVNPDNTNFTFATTATGDNSVAALSGNNGRTAPFAVASEQTSTRNAATLGTSTVSGTAFVDGTADGRQGGAGDAPLGGATASLTLTVALPNLSTTVTRSATTDGATGNYSFAGLPGGGYNLSFAAPAATPAWIRTTADVGPDDTGDSDSELSGQTLAAGATADRDQGYYQPATITARVFDEQTTVDNTFQPTEAGIGGVTVTLNPGGATQTTDATGLATFTVTPGTSFTLTVSDPAGFSRSPGNGGSVTLGPVTSGSTSANAPFGYYKAGSISGDVWYDGDGDGTYDIGEEPMEGLDVRLFGSSDSTTPVATATTTAAGNYSFSNVLPTGGSFANSSYRVCFELPAGFAFTAKGTPLTTDGNSDANPDGCTDTFSFGSNGALTAIDAGYVGAQTIGDLVWNDLNANGIQDAGEPGLAGATVTLQLTTTGGVINATNPTVTLTATTTASASLGANYQITRVPPASGWTVVSVAPPFGYKASPANQGADDTVDSDAPGAYSVAVPPSVTSLDFGFYQASAIGDFVWLDLNGNGVYDAATERGVPNVAVQLIKDGNPVDQTSTSATEPVGSYSFVDLDPGTYTLRFVPPAGYGFVNNGAGSVTVDNDNDARLDGTTAPITLANGQAVPSVDAGLVGTASLGGIAWIDDNNDATRGSADTRRVTGVQVTLTMTATLTGGQATYTATTGADGSYSFANLPAGSGTVRFAAPGAYIPVRPNVGSDQADSDGPVVSVTIAAGQSVGGVDQGYRERGRIIWLPLVNGDRLKPDLAVTFKVGPSSPTAGKATSIEVVVTNKGTGPASGFWVDFHINPSRVPEVNDRWNELCRLEPCFGMAWYYEGTVQPGQSVTLNSAPQSATNPNGFEVDSSNWPGFFANGTNLLFAVVDSWNRSSAGDTGDPSGALRELDETNNREMQLITVFRGSLPPEFSQLPSFTISGRKNP